jgi:four helix bundle protein
MQTHKDLQIWQSGIELVEIIYKITTLFPASEMYGLTSQMRRAAVSVPSNIAEGAARQGEKEFVQFLYVALGSLSELETQAIIAVRLGYMSDSSVLESIEALRRKMLNFIKFRKKLKPVKDRSGEAVKRGSGTSG